MVSEKDLGTDESGAVGARRGARHGIGQGRDVGLDQHASTAARERRLVGTGRRCRCLLAARLRQSVDLLLGRGVGIEPQRAGPGVDPDQCAFGDALRLAAAGEDRDPARRGDDHTVSRSTTSRGHDSERGRGIEAGSRGCVELVDDEDVRRAGRRLVGRAHQNLQNLTLETAYVLAALPQVRVGQGVEIRSDCAEARSYGIDGRCAGRRVSCQSLCQVGVTQQSFLGLEDPALWADRYGQPSQGRGHRRDCRLEAGLLVFGSAGGVPPGVDVAAPHQRRADHYLTPGTRRICRSCRRRSSRLLRLAEVCSGQGEEPLTRRPGVRAGERCRQGVALQQPESCDFAHAARGGRSLVERGVAKQYGRVESPEARHERCRGSSVQTMRIPYDNLGRRALDRHWFSGLSRLGCSRLDTQVLGLRRETSLGLSGNLGERGARTGGHHRGDKPFDERSGRYPYPLRRRGVDELQRHLRRQHSAAEVEQHQHTVGRVDGRDRLGDRRGIRTERRLVQAGRDPDPGSRLSGHHLLGQPHGGVGERSTVRDDDDADHRIRRAFSPRPR